ncbi:MAG: superoxide dismutase [Ni] [Pseudomonadota bacterium]
MTLTILKIRTDQVHCDIPIVAFNPSIALQAAASVVADQDALDELPERSIEPNPCKNPCGQRSHLIEQKKNHLAKVVSEVSFFWRHCWAKESKDIGLHNLISDIFATASACQASHLRADSARLIELMNTFALEFWRQRNVKTHLVLTPFAPGTLLIEPLRN